MKLLDYTNISSKKFFVIIISIYAIMLKQHILQKKMF